MPGLRGTWLVSVCGGDSPLRINFGDSSSPEAEFESRMLHRRHLRRLPAPADNPARIFWGRTTRGRGFGHRGASMLNYTAASLDFAELVRDVAADHAA